jgi:hypothetical protein
MSLVVAAAVWYLIKKNQDSTPEGWPMPPERHKSATVHQS